MAAAPLLIGTFDRSNPLENARIAGQGRQAIFGALVWTESEQPLARADR